MMKGVKVGRTIAPPYLRKIHAALDPLSDECNGDTFCISFYIWELDGLSFHDSMLVASPDKLILFPFRPDDEWKATAVESADEIASLRVARNPSRIPKVTDEGSSIKRELGKSRGETKEGFHQPLFVFLHFVLELRIVCPRNLTRFESKSPVDVGGDWWISDKVTQSYAGDIKRGVGCLRSRVVLLIARRLMTLTASHFPSPAQPATSSSPTTP